MSQSTVETLGPARHPFPLDTHPEGELHTRCPLRLTTMHVEGETVTSHIETAIGWNVCVCDGAICINCLRVAFLFSNPKQPSITAAEAAKGLAEVYRVMSQPALKAQMQGGVNVGMIHDKWKAALAGWRLQQRAGKFVRGSALDNELGKLEALLSTCIGNSPTKNKYR